MQDISEKPSSGGPAPYDLICEKPAATSAPLPGPGKKEFEEGGES